MGLPLHTYPPTHTNPLNLTLWLCPLNHTLNLTLRVCPLNHTLNLTLRVCPQRRVCS